MERTLAIVNHLSFAIVLATVVLGLLNFWLQTQQQKALTYSQQKKKKKAEPKPYALAISDRTYYIILALVILVGVAIRLWQFGSVPGGFNQDGAMAAVDGKALADYGTDRFGTWLPAHLYAWGFGQMSSLLSYLIAIFVKFFGLSPITARLPQLLASLAGGVFFYLFIKDIFGKGAGLIAAIFVAINPWHLVQSRWALDCNLLPHFFMGGLYFLNKGLTKHRKYTFVSMVFFALCMYCYGITIYTIPVFLLAVCGYYLFQKRLTWQDALICAGIYLALSWPFLLTMVVNFMKWQTIKLPFVTIQYFDSSVRSSDILLFSKQPWQQLPRNLEALLNTTWNQKKDLPWNDIAGFGTMFLCTMPFVFAGFVELARHKTDGAKGLVLFALMAGVWVGIMTNYVNVNRINLVYYGIMMFAVLGIYFTIKQFKHTMWTTLGVYLLLGTLLVATYFTTYANEIKISFYDGFGQALLSAEAANTQKLYITADAQGKGMVGTSQILTMFYDQTDAQYFQGKKSVQKGKQLLPFDQRFSFVSMSPAVLAASQNESAAYVIMASDKGYFDAARYNVKDFGNFCAVTQK